MKFTITLLIIYTFFLNNGIAQQSVYNAAGSHTFTNHPSVIELTVEAIGGGGRGGRVSGNLFSGSSRAGGGGGGAYAKGRILVTPSATYNVNVGVGANGGNDNPPQGGDSWFNSGSSTDAATTVRAQGGRSRNGTGQSGGAAGGSNSSPNSIGNMNTYAGGNGGSSSSNNRGGGGGGAAGSTGNGDSGQSGCNCNGGGAGGTGALLNGATAGSGGVGGVSGGNDTGLPGVIYGGGGGGSRKSGGNNTRNGREGERGIVVVSWSRIDNISAACQGLTATITGFNFSTTLAGTPVTTTNVTLNGTSIPYTVNSNTQITITIPAGATSGNVIVTTTLGRAQYYLPVSTSSIAPASVSGGGNYCYGNQVTLTANGATLGAGASYRWYTGSCGGTLVATTTTPVYTFTPNTPGTTTYFVRVEGGCNTTSCASTTVTLPAATGNLSVDGESASCSVSGTGWIHFRNASSGRLLVAVDPQGQNLGNVAATSYVQTAPITVAACDAPLHQTAVLGRRWVITPQNQPASPVRVRLYFNNPEYLSLNPVANTNDNTQDNTAAFSDLHLSKYRNDGSPLVNSSPHDNCSSGVTTIWTPQGSGNISSVFSGFDANGRYTEYTIPDFSEFWLHGSLDLSPLAVVVSDFSVTCGNNENKITWRTISEQNSSHFIVERSRDGKIWNEVSIVEGAGTTNSATQYETTDDYFNQEVYYRLQQVDFNGNTELIGIKNLVCSPSENKLIVYPNPAQDVFTLEIHSNEKSSEGLIQLYDLTGKIVHSQQTTIKKGINSIYLDQSLRKGTYIISVQTESFRYKPTQVIIR